MKQNNIVTLIIIVVIAGLVSLTASKYIFTTAADRQQAVEVVPVITANLPTPSSTYFNSQSIDPTQLIQIGTTTNNNPFSSPSQ
jgi:Flp pilus assembly protein CpaB